MKNKHWMIMMMKIVETTMNCEAGCLEEFHGYLLLWKHSDWKSCTKDFADVIILELFLSDFVRGADRLQRNSWRIFRAYSFGSCLTFTIFINDCFLFDVCFSFAWVKSRMSFVIHFFARLIKQPIPKLRILIFFDYFSNKSDIFWQTRLEKQIGH